MIHQARSSKLEARSRIERRSNDLGYTIAAVVIAVLALAAALLAPKWLPARWAEWCGSEGITGARDQGIEPEENMPEEPINPSGVRSSDLPSNPQQGATQDQVAIVARLYQSAAVEINKDLAKAIRQLGDDPESRGAAFRLQRSSGLLDQIDGHLRRANAGAASVMSDAAQRSVQLGLVQARSQMQELGVEPREGFQPSFTNVDPDVVNIVAADTMAIIARSANDMKSSAERVFRAVSATNSSGRKIDGVPLNEAIAVGLISGDPRKAERAVRELFRGDEDAEVSYRKLGARKISVGGWTGTVAAYSAMVARTRMREATVNARHTRLSRSGIGLVQITGRDSENFCTRFLGMVFAISPDATDDGKYPLLSSLPVKGPPFHPNCSKGTAAFIPGLVSPEREASAQLAAEKFASAKESGSLTKPLRVGEQSAEAKARVAERRNAAKERAEKERDRQEARAAKQLPPGLKHSSKSKEDDDLVSLGIFKFDGTVDPEQRRIDSLPYNQR